MMLRHSLGDGDGGARIEAAVDAVLDRADCGLPICSPVPTASAEVGTAEMTDAVVAAP